MIIKIVVAILTFLFSASVPAQENQPIQKKQTTRVFQWVNPLKSNQLTGVEHAVFRSKSMGCNVGYCIYLPPQYSAPENAQRKFPVVYYLHGGRPGSELKSSQMARYIHAHIESGKVPPMIYVFVNGGPVSHYNMPEMKHGMGKNIFVDELIPHVDETYRTIANRGGRGLEGFSQGGRGAVRNMFRHPNLFCSVAPGGGGFATEKKISENNGYENENLRFIEGDNAWDLARAYAKASLSKRGAPALRIQFHVGTKGFNYRNNLEYMGFLDELNIPYEKVIVEGAKHSASQIYKAKGDEIMNFHAKNFSAQ